MFYFPVTKSGLLHSGSSTTNSFLTVSDQNVAMENDGLFGFVGVSFLQTLKWDRTPSQLTKNQDNINVQNASGPHLMPKSQLPLWVDMGCLPGGKWENLYRYTCTRLEFTQRDCRANILAMMVILCVISKTLRVCRGKLGETHCTHFFHLFHHPKPCLLHKGPVSPVDVISAVLVSSVFGVLLLEMRKLNRM